MGRLTFEGNFCDIAQCRELPCPYNGACSQRKVWERLKAYEDTGLEPAMCANYKTFENEAISKGVTFKRIVALMEADRTGRLAVLPCKVGDRLYELQIMVALVGLLGAVALAVCVTIVKIIRMDVRASGR
jgi:hypothetical protein